MKNSFILLILIIFLGLLLRIYNLTNFPIFGDEAIYIRWAQQMRQFPELRFVPLSDGKQPLFMWSIIPFTKMFSDPLVAGRVVSVITGMATMMGVFILTLILFSYEIKKTTIKPEGGLVSTLRRVMKDSHDITAALTASLLYAISPFSIFFDRMALADTMLGMFGVWTLVFGLLTVLFIRLDTAILGGFALGGALLTKSPGAFFAILLPSVVIFRIFKDKKVDFFDKNLMILTPLFVVTYIISYGLYNILRLGTNFHMLESRTLDYVHPYDHILTSPLDPLLPFLDRVKEYLLILGPGTVYILLGIGGYYLFKKNKAALVILMIWSLVPIFIVSGFTKVMTARYVYFAIPYLFVIASAIVYYKGKIKNVLFFGVFITVLMSFLWNWYYHTDLDKLPLPQSERSGYLEEWTSGTGIQESKEFLSDQLNENPDTHFVVGTEGHFGTLPQGIEIYFPNEPRVQVVGVGLNIEEVPQELIAAKAEGKKVYLIINNDRLKFDPASMTGEGLALELIKEFPKAERDEGTKQYLHLYELK